jgi:hypothetical protein
LPNTPEGPAQRACTRQVYRLLHLDFAILATHDHYRIIKRDELELLQFSQPIPHLFGGLLVHVVFFVYGPKRREMLLSPLEADVVRHNRCRPHR